jgi:autotransporter-associated beta strand protein
LDDKHRNGINPSATPNAFFLNGQTPPDGAYVSFIQIGGSLQQSVSGFTIGQTYQLSYFEAERGQAGAVSRPYAKVGGQIVVAEHDRARLPQGFVQILSEPFVATATTMLIELGNNDPAQAGAPTGDNTALFDRVWVRAFTPTAAPVIPHGGFEEVAQPANNWKQASGAGGGSLNGSAWIWTAGGGVTRNLGAFHPGGPAASEGVQFALFQNVSSAVQTVQGFSVGNTYNLSFDVAKRNTTNGNDLKIILDEGLPTQVVLYDNPEITNNAFAATTTAGFIAQKASYTITLRGTRMDGDRTTYVDNLRVTSPNGAVITLKEVAGVDTYQVGSGPVVSVTNASLTINGTSGDDTLVVDYSGGNPIPVGGMTFNGGGQVSTNPADRIVLQNGSATNVNHAFTNNSDGTINIDGSVVTYTGLEPITDNLSVTDRVFTFTGAAENITISDDPGSLANVTRIDSSLGEHVDFTTPTNSLRLVTNGGDTGSINAFDPIFNTPSFILEDLSGTASPWSLGAAERIPNATSVTITGDAVLNLAGVNETINALNGNGRVNNAAAAPSVLTVSSGAFSGVLSNSGTSTLGLTKVSLGTLTLSGAAANTASGPTTVNDGDLVLQKTAGLTAIAGPLNIGNASGSDVVRLAANDQIADGSVITFLSGGGGNSAKFELNGYNETVGGIQSNANQASVIQNTEAGAPAGGNNPALLTVNSAASFIYDGLIRNGGGGSIGLVKDGTGTLTLRDGFGANLTNYTGGTTINGGRLVVDNLSAFVSSPIIINSTAADALTFNQTTNNLSVAALISGAGHLTKSGAATLTLINTSNSYAGVTTFAGGVLDAASLSNFGANSSLGNRAADSGPGNVGLLFRGGTLRYSGVANQSTNRAVRISTTGGGTIESSGTGTLSFTAASSPDFFENPGARTLTLTGTNTGANVFAMQISQAGGQTTLNKQGVGTWQITNNTNNYTGETILGGGVLNVSSVSDYGLPSAIGARTLGEENGGLTGVGLHFVGGTLQYTGASNQSTNRHIRVFTGLGATIDSSGTGTLSFTRSGANINLFDSPGTRTITLTGTNTGTNTFSLTLENQGGSPTSLLKNGVGRWILNGVNTNTGTTTVNAGNLTLQGGAAIANNSGLVSVADGATLQLDASETVGSFSGAALSTLVLQNFGLTASTGNVPIGSVTTGNTGRITALGGAIVDNNGATNNISGVGVTLEATAGIGDGDAIETQVSNLETDNNDGLLAGANGTNVQITNSVGGLLTVTDVTSGAGLGGADNAEGATTIINGSPLTIASSSISAGPVVFTAMDSMNPGDDLTVNSGVTVQSTGSSVTLNGGDDVNLLGTAVVAAATTITVNVDANVVDPDVGVGGVLRWRRGRTSARRLRSSTATAMMIRSARRWCC